MQPTIVTKIQTRDWRTVKRVRVRETVQHRNAYWSNTTGINSEPEYGSPNWQYIEEAEPYYKRLKIDKHPSNTGKGLEINDCVRGFLDDEMYLITAFYLGGDKDDINSYDIVNSQPLI